MKAINDRYERCLWLWSQNGKVDQEKEKYQINKLNKVVEEILLLRNKRLKFLKSYVSKTRQKDWILIW